MMSTAPLARLRSPHRPVRKISVIEVHGLPLVVRQAPPQPLRGAKPEAPEPPVREHDLDREEENRVAKDRRRADAAAWPKA